MLHGVVRHTVSLLEISNVLYCIADSEEEHKIKEYANQESCHADTMILVENEWHHNE